MALSARPLHWTFLSKGLSGGESVGHHSLVPFFGHPILHFSQLVSFARRFISLLLVIVPSSLFPPFVFVTRAAANPTFLTFSSSLSLSLR